MNVRVLNFVSMYLILTVFNVVNRVIITTYIYIILYSVMYRFCIIGVL